MKKFTKMILEGAKVALDSYLEGHAEGEKAAQQDVRAPGPAPAPTTGPIPPPPGAEPFGPAGERGVDLRQDALGKRVEIVPLPQDKTGLRWDIADKQIQYEARFAAFCMAWWNAEGPAPTFDEVNRRALIATSVFHGIAIEDLPPHLREKTGE